MTADNSLTVTISQDLTSGQVSVSANKPMSFNIALRLYLVALKGLKDNLMGRLDDMSRDDIIKYAFGEAFQETADNQLPEDEATLKEDILSRMESEMYDMLNLGVGNFLDTEFPRVNAKLSLTEEAAKEANLDRTATDEELVQAEIDFIEKHPDIAAQCADLQPTEVKSIDGPLKS